MKIAYDFFVSHCIVMYILIGIYHFSMRQRAIKFIGKYYPDAQDASFVKMNLYKNIIIGLFWPWHEALSAISYFSRYSEMMNKLDEQDNNNEGE